MSERTKIIAETIPELRSELEYHYRIWDNGDVELCGLFYDSWSLRNRYGNTDLWKENIRKLIPGKRYRFVSFDGNSLFKDCFREATSGDNYDIMLEVHGFGPIKCTECGSQNIKDSRCLDCGEWL